MTGSAGSPSADGTSRTLRSGLLALAALSVLAIGYELFAERHWGSTVQLVPWLVLVLLAVAIGLAWSARRPAVLLARMLAGLALVASAFGIYEHAASNYQNGELDATYSDTWATTTFPEKVLLAVTKTVGATPPIAPGALGQAGLLVLLATVGRGHRG